MFSWWAVWIFGESKYLNFWKTWYSINRFYTCSKIGIYSWCNCLICILIDSFFLGSNKSHILMLPSSLQDTILSEDTWNNKNTESRIRTKCIINPKNYFDPIQRRLFIYYDGFSSHPEALSGWDLKNFYLLWQFRFSSRTVAVWWWFRWEPKPSQQVKILFWVRSKDFFGLMWYSILMNLLGKWTIVWLWC